MSKKFDIYFGSPGALEKLYKINQNSAGIYFQPFGRWPHFSYHTSGESHYRHPAFKEGVTINTKVQRTPLNEFIGPESVTSLLAGSFTSRSNNQYKARPQDIVLAVKPPFYVEIILTSKEIELEKLPDRRNSQIFFKKETSPMIIIEAFNVEDGRLPEQRFRMVHPTIIS